MAMKARAVDKAVDKVDISKPRNWPRVRGRGALQMKCRHVFTRMSWRCVRCGVPA